MNYISLCDGIGAAHVAWKPLGWKCLGVSEINSFCNRVIEHRWGFENLGALDETKTIEKIRIKKPDLIIGGTPCQSFSVAGKREGLDVDHGRLILWFLQAIYRAKPKYFLWENVFGAFSTDKGAVLRAFVASLAECGYLVEWRTLDAQFFGVPQRRRRVFVVGHLGGERGRTIFPATESGCGNFAKGKKTRQGDSRKIANCPGSRSDNVVCGTLTASTGGPSINKMETYVCDTVTRKWAKGSGGPSGDECQNLIAIPLQEINKRTGVSANDRSFGIGIGNANDPMYTLQSRSQHGVAQIAETITRQCRNNTNAGNNAGVVNPIYTQTGVRRLTPIETERLQGLPDNYTLIPIKTTKKGKVIMSCDTHRYEAIGNSMAVPVVRWIGERIREHHER